MVLVVISINSIRSLSRNTSPGICRSTRPDIASNSGYKWGTVLFMSEADCLKMKLVNPIFCGVSFIPFRLSGRRPSEAS